MIVSEGYNNIFTKTNNMYMYIVGVSYSKIQPKVALFTKLDISFNKKAYSQCSLYHIILQHHSQFNKTVQISTINYNLKFAKSKKYTP